MYFLVLMNWNKSGEMIPMKWRADSEHSDLL
jgi:hypothetical protein